MKIYFPTALILPDFVNTYKYQVIDFDGKGKWTSANQNLTKQEALKEQRRRKRTYRNERFKKK